MGILLKVGNVFTHVENGDWETQKIIWESLSYTVEGAKYIAQKTGTNWDGIKTFYKGDERKFHTGLLPKVIRALISGGIQHKIVDMRVKPPREFKQHDLNGIILRDYQENTVQSMINKGRGIVKLATGAGKTEIGISATKAIDVPTIFLTHRRNLMRQTYHRYLKRYPEISDQIGMIGDGVYSPGKVTIAMVQTVASMMQRKKKIIIPELEKYEALIIDEAHRCGAKQFWNTAEHCKNAYYRWMLTATPFLKNAHDNLMLEGLGGEIIANVTATELIERGFLARPLFKFININEPENISRYRNWRDIYERGISLNEHRNNVIVNQTCSLLKMGRKTLVIVVEKEHGRLLDSMLKKRYVKSVYVDGNNNTDERERSLKALETGSIDCIICTNIFDEGIDTDCIQAVVLAAGTKSAPALLQRTGRAMRRKEKENYCVIIDFIDKTHDRLLEHSMTRYELVQQEEGYWII